MSFCKTVWNGVHILPGGDVRLCSINNDNSNESGVGRDEHGAVINILTHDIHQLINTDKHIKVRKLNIEQPGAWHSMCKCCEKKEIATDANSDGSTGLVSRRIYLDDEISDEVNSDNYTELSSDGIVNWMPSSLDLRFGNLCNQACVQCGPFYSNKWIADSEAYNLAPDKGAAGWGPSTVAIVKNSNNKLVQTNKSEWWESDIWWAKFKIMMPGLSHIYLTGGEPMIVSGHDTLLDILIESGDAAHIKLEYDSNCTCINTKLLDKWTHFKSVEIRASMDAIGDKYELIRYGGHWETFKKNVALIKELSIKTEGKVKLSTVTTCFQLSTSHSMIEAEQWCIDNDYHFHMRFVDSPAIHSVDFLSMAAKQELIELYSKYDTVASNAIVAYLSKTKHKWDPMQVNQYIRFMDFLDGRRNTDWKAVLPDTYNFLKKHSVKFKEV